MKKNICFIFIYMIISIFDSIIFSQNLSQKEIIYFKSHQKMTMDFVLDDDGNYIVRGVARSKVYIQTPIILDSLIINNEQGFAVKISKSGSIIWKTYADASYDDYTIQTIDNNVYLGDYYPVFGTTVITKEALANDSLYKFFGIRHLNKDSDGNIICTGSERKNFDFDPGTGIYTIDNGNTDLNYDLYFGKYTKNGGVIWMKTIKGEGYDSGKIIHEDKNRNLLLVSVISGPVDIIPSISGNEITDVTFAVAMLCKFNDEGNVIWYKKFGGKSNNAIHGITTDSHGNIYITGQFHWTIKYELNNQTIERNSNGAADVFVAKLNQQGDIIWLKTFGGDREDVGKSISLDSFGNVIIGGHFEKYVNFGGTSASIHTTGNSLRGSFIQIYSNEGVYTNTYSFLTDVGKCNLSKIVNKEGQLVLLGDFENNIDFNLTTKERVTSSFRYNAYLTTISYQPAKKYIPLLSATDWVYNVGDFGGTQSFYLTKNHDTIIANKKYSILFNKAAPIKDLYIYIREDSINKIVYEYSKFLNTEVILYNFNLKVGDTFYPPGVTSKYTVAKIDTVQSTLGPLLRWHFDGPFVDFTYTELIGGRYMQYYIPLIYSDPTYGLNCVFQYCNKVFGNDNCMPSPHRSITTEENISICNGEIYQGHDESGQYQTSSIDIYGCVKTNILNLLVEPQAITENLYTNYCIGDTFKMNGQYITKDTIFRDTLYSSQNCPIKFHNTSISFIAKQIFTIDTSICEGQSFMGQSESGTYIFDTITTSYPCKDSFIVYLTVLPSTDARCGVSSNGHLSISPFKITPNPILENLFIQGNYPAGSLVVYDNFGHVMLKIEFKDLVNNINTALWPSGLYYIVFFTSTGNQHFSQKIIKL